MITVEQLAARCNLTPRWLRGMIARGLSVPGAVPGAGVRGDGWRCPDTQESIRAVEEWRRTHRAGRRS